MNNKEILRDIRIKIDDISKELLRDDLKNG